MHALKLLPLALLLACGGSDDHHDSDHASETSDEHATHATHVSHGEMGEHGEASSTGHHHEPTTGTDTGHHHDSSTGHHGDSSTGESNDPIIAYCDCMVVYCHDEYHGTWGEEHPDSEQNCQAAAGMVPSVGMPASAGDSIECRLHYCDAAMTDPAACASAIGGGMCV